ncbi:hypothetical protein OHI65_08540 [Brucella sp. MAB-22]|uniref:hypothetical protein n=1 Tax=Brucella TaxID=234 RepID=UPI000F678F25|nr:MULTISPECIES: hypothetical protein [Brucella]RRY16440.1 hypothetical protein EGJ57_21285 [Brucella anthropi]UYT54410.1 hypothetical protein OHI65_08540 [Brucella sp. MAB-22]
MKAGACILFAVLHIAQIFLIIILLKNYNFVDPNLIDSVSKAKPNDTYSIAMQLGRFDLVTTLLTVISIIIALAALLGFLEIRSKTARIANDVAKDEAEKVAKQAAEIAAKEVARSVAETMVKSELPALVRRESDELRSVGRLLDEVQTSEGKPQDVIDSLDGDKS